MGKLFSINTTNMGELFNTRVLQINLKLVMTIETQWFPKGGLFSGPAKEEPCKKLCPI